MSTHESHSGHHVSAYHAPDEDVFSANAVRLSPMQCLIAGVILLLIYVGLPVAWKWLEPLRAGPHYRIPYALSEDYWLYSRHAEESLKDNAIAIIGDSVVWGQYVKPDETLSSALNEELGEQRFVNLGLNGSHPAALAGLIKHYGSAIAGRKIVLHYNPLWTTSLRRDLQTDKPATFNHPKLVPQFFPRISSYDATGAQRLSRAIGNRITFLMWIDHIAKAYFDNQKLATWTMANPYRDPLSSITRVLPQPEPTEPSPPVPWLEKDAQLQNFEWVEPSHSLQWRFFKDSVNTLKARGNDVFVIVGPFNEHLLTDESRILYRNYLEECVSWLQSQNIAYLAPEPLPSQLYADASHPLREGYILFAENLLKDTNFSAFIAH